MSIPKGENRNNVAGAPCAFDEDGLLSELVKHRPRHFDQPIDGQSRCGNPTGTVVDIWNIVRVSRTEQASASDVPDGNCFLLAKFRRVPPMRFEALRAVRQAAFIPRIPKFLEHMRWKCPQRIAPFIIAPFISAILIQVSLKLIITRPVKAVIPSVLPGVDRLAVCFIGHPTKV